VEVELYSGDSMLDRATATRRQEVFIPPVWRPYLIITMAFIAALLVFIAIFFLREEKERKSSL